MGVIKPSNRTMYMGCKTRVDFITSSMSINWFDEIVFVLYFKDSTTYQIAVVHYIINVFKIQSLIGHFPGNFFL